MLFSSITFIYFFLPVTLVVTFLTPKKWRNLILLVASFLFYAWGSLKYCFLLAGSILIGYFAGVWLDKAQRTNMDEREIKKNTRWIVIAAIGFLTGSLVVCKYVPWLSSIGNHLTQGMIPTLKWMLPIGISFYTFQMISYVYDVYSGRIPAEKSLIKLATYISMFPQLIAGPIVRYETVREELDHRELNWEKMAIGVRRFVFGLSKKVLLADVLGELVEILRGMEGKSTVMYWVMMIAYSLQLYLDFSGYSDMAIGLGSMLGFSIPENFQYPFISKSITEFWRRWHRSLSSWFRDYVYIPLGGNRVHTGRWMLNMLIAWGLSGLWHGAGGHFLMWGIYFGIWLIIEKMWLHKVLDKLPGWLLHIYTLLVVIISFVFFQMDMMTEAWNVIAGMFGLAKGDVTVRTMGMYQIRKYFVVMGIGCLVSTPIIPEWIRLVSQKNRMAKRVILVLEPLALLGLITLVTSFLLNSNFHPFLYFRF